MCGIFGWILCDESYPVSAGWDGLCSMTDRGPDDWGLYLDSHGKITEESGIPTTSVPLFLGNRRLSILDLSDAGNQPMTNETEELWIVYNGEIYNHEELREELRDVGHTFTSECDTEVIIHAYEEYGEDCLKRFNGMFAFALWDRTADELFAARDPLGIKPFYYSTTDGLVFSSEVTALLDADVVATDLDLDSVAEFLALGYVPTPGTILEDVHSLPPGATLRYEKGSDEVTVSQYTHLDFTPSDGGQRGTRGTESCDATTTADIRELLRESVRLRLRSDVPVGAFLSGGLDSSSIVALMCDVSPSDSEGIETFSIGFEEADFSETSYANEVADEFGTAHTERTITADEVREELSDIIAAMDQPSIDGVNTYFVSQTAAQNGLRVALSGLGGDELFFGYPGPFKRIPQLFRIAATLNRLPDPLPRIGADVLELIGDISSKPLLTKLPAITESDHTFGASYLAVRGLYDEDDRHYLLASDISDLDLDDRLETTVTETLRNATWTDAVSHAELLWYMQNQLLRDTDTMSMSHSLEVRVPFLDESVVDTVTRLPAPEKRPGFDKSLLKEAMAEDLPESVLTREKTGFAFPFSEWLTKELSPLVDRALDDVLLQNTPLEPAAVDRVRTEFESGDRHWLQLWALVVLSLWIEEHLVAEGPTQTADAT